MPTLNTWTSGLESDMNDKLAILEFGSPAIPVLQQQDNRLLVMDRFCVSKQTVTDDTTLNTLSCLSFCSNAAMPVGCLSRL